ncbi:MAG TPA: cytochrome c maturation protein CcmE [Gammaproteobacteria bacterium]|jgi:cytochrome c-type biogenesis protein CcmE|nr:cytochrome c maturation protein CcmE [Gammaproteobacteria bacterium]
MTPSRRRRLVIVVVLLLGIGTAVAFGLTAFRKNILYYYTPTQVAAGAATASRPFRMGGLVAMGSVQRESGTMTVHFALTDMQKSVPITYTGILPDLFREGQGIVVHGSLGTDGRFTADEVLAKHDEKYMPPEVAAAIRKAKQQAAAEDESKP